MKPTEKTNVMRLLEQKKIPYESFTYEADPTKTGEEIASMLGESPDLVFKTLVTQGKSGEHYVFVIPVNTELDLKLAAKTVSEKSVSMLKQKELLPLTGYVHGGCSPIGMKKFFKTTFHETMAQLDHIYFSAGKVGYQVKVTPKDLEKIIRFQTADIIIHV
ncbi:MAG: Cys-tRNA(Pro) deacylase [Lachnospiraceae bacterium]|nr:Cys-tRNA(Pro) deacylase [Lachnospiraceae bacterium]